MLAPLKWKTVLLNTHKVIAQESQLPCRKKALLLPQPPDVVLVEVLLVSGHTMVKMTASNPSPSRVYSMNAGHHILCLITPIWWWWWWVVAEQLWFELSGNSCTFYKRRVQRPFMHLNTSNYLSPKLPSSSNGIISSPPGAVL